MKTICANPNRCRCLANNSAFGNRALVLTAAVILCVCASPHGAVGQTGRLEGTIVNLQTGDPVPEARVTIEGMRGLYDLTDRQGRYIILDVPAGVHNVRVEAIGFELKVHLNHRVLPLDRSTSDIQPVRLDIRLMPSRSSAAGSSTSTAELVAIGSGLGVGVSVGIQDLVGTENRYIDPGRGTDLFIRYGMPFGLALHAGGHFGNFGVNSMPQDLGVSGFYFEPRFLFLRISPRWAPFVASQIAFIREAMQTDRAEFTASGRSAGAGIGAVYRIASQIVIEGGLSAGLATQDDYSFRGDLETYRCMEGVETGTPLPETIARCGELVTPLPIYSCYPPFSDRLGGDCQLPEIHRENSRRSGGWYLLKVGIQVVLGSRR